MRRLVTAVLLQATLVGAPVVDEKLDDALWQKAREALGASPASTIVHSHFSKWLDDRLDAALGDDAGATGAGGVAAFVRNISALPKRPVIGLRVAKRNASGLCAFVEEAVPALDRAKHIEAYALTSVGTAANGSPFHPHSLKGCEQACPGAVASLLAQPKLQQWYVSQHWAPPPHARNMSSSKRLRRQVRLEKVQQIPLGVHLTLAAARGLEAAWAATSDGKRSLIASHVSLHNHERAFAFDQLRNALKRGDVSLENEFPVKTTDIPPIAMNAEQWTAKVHARRLAGGKHGSFQQTRNTTNNLRSLALASYLYKLRTTKFAFSPIGSGLDCHRHYEILAFGAVPLVDYSETLVELYRNLPMVFVRQWTKVTRRTLERAWGAVLDRRASYDYSVLRRDTWRKRVLAFRDRQTYAKALWDTPRKRTGKDDPAWRSDRKTCKGVAKKNKCSSKVGDDGVPAVIACPVACAPSLLPPIVIGAGPTAETREETVFDDGGNATLPDWVGTSKKAKTLGSGKSVHRWARKSHLAKLAKFEH